MNRGSGLWFGVLVAALVAGTWALSAAAVGARALGQGGAAGVKVEYMVPDTLLASYAETAPLPEFDAGSIQEMTLRYSGSVEVGGEAIEVDVKRQIVGGEVKGTSAWTIVTVSDSKLGAVTDTFYVDKASLAPIARSIQRGQMRVFGEYLADSISGRITMGSQQIPINVSLTAPVAADESGLEVAVGALPLDVGYKTTLRLFDVVGMKVRPWSLEVTGVEKVNVPAGSFDAYKVALEPLDGGADATTMYVMKEGPRCLLRKAGKLPAVAGGGSTSMEMVKMEAME